MSEGTFKIIFALVVLIFVALGRDTATTPAATAFPRNDAVPILANSVVITDNESLVIPFKRGTAKSETALSENREPPRIEAPIFLIVDLRSGKDIAERFSHKRWPIASITKLVTAIIAFEELGPRAEITVDEALQRANGTVGDFIPGRVFEVEDLVKAMMISSSNYAALLLQEHIGKDKFVLLMNGLARRLGMQDSYFQEATGLSVVNQSTARDLQILVNYVWNRRSEIFLYSRIPQMSIVDKSTGMSTIIENINSLAKNSDFLGGKTGLINHSKGNLISIFSRSSGPIMTIVLGAEDRFAETQELMRWVDRVLANN